MIDPTLHSGDNIIINFLAPSYRVIKLTENDDGSVFSLKPVTLNGPLYGMVHKIHDAFHKCLLEVMDVNHQLLLIEDFQNCFVVKQL
jgi:hypothetical protein